MSDGEAFNDRLIVHLESWRFTRPAGIKKEVQSPLGNLGIRRRLETVVIKNRYHIDGKFWLRMSHAAHLLGTTTPVLKRMMGDGALDWRQSRANSKIFVVDEEAILALRAERQQWLKEGAARAEPERKPSGDEMSVGTVPAFRARLRNQVEMYLPAADGGAPGRRRG